MKKSVLSALFLAFILFTGISCKDSKPQFTIEGKISNADSTTLYLEKRGLSETIIIDSIRLNADGNYTLKGDAPQYSEFYVLRLNNQAINIAIDSIETIKINADKPTFATTYTVEGSIDSEKMKEVTLAQYKLTKDLRRLTAMYNAKEITGDEYADQTAKAINSYKIKAQDIVRSNYAGMAAYYALYQKVDGLLIFDLYDKTDRRLFQSTATSWKNKRPDSPRTIQMEQFVLEVLADIKRTQDMQSRLQDVTEKNVVDSQEYYNISLPDKSGKQIEIASFKGKPVLLDFTSYRADFSPAHNIQLNSLYEKYKDKFVIYQVSFDDDDHIWRNAVSNLPWVCVRDSKSFASDLLLKFNVQGLPTIFLIDKKGYIAKRIHVSDNMENEIKKIL